MPNLAPTDVNSPNYYNYSPPSSTSYAKFPKDLDAKYSTTLQFYKVHRDLKSTSIKKLNQTTIFLPLPSNLPESYSISYNNPGLTNLNVKLLELFKAGYSSYEKGEGVNDLNVLKDAAKDAASQILNGNIDYANLLDIAKKAYGFIPQSFLDTPAGKLAALEIGAVPNPHMAAVFSASTPRSGVLSWKLSSRNKDESNTLNRIINYMRQKSHPSLSTNDLLLEFPYQVKVDFYPKTFLHPYKDAVITNIVIDNTPSGHPNFYSGGAPTEIILSITLQETSIRTSEDFGSDESL